MNQKTEEQAVNPPAGKSPVGATEVQKTSQLPEASRAEVANLDKIRDILFGAHAQNYEKRIARLEENILKQTADLRDELRRRCDSLESYIKREVESLQDRVKAEQNERKDSTRKLGLELKEISEVFDRKTTQMTEQANASQRDLRQQLLEQSKSLSDDIRQKIAEISALLEQQLQEVRTEKTDRSALAALFVDVAMRLNHELQLPDAVVGHDVNP